MKILNILVFASLILSIASLSIAALNKDSSAIASPTNNIGDPCNNHNVILDSKCLNEELRSFWIYNLSNVGKRISIEELRNEGGVCSNAVDFYIQRFKDIGYEERVMGNKIYEKDTSNDLFITSTTFRTSNSSAHIVAIASGTYIENNQTKWAYCILDQEKVHCQELGE